MRTLLSFISITAIFAYTALIARDAGALTEVRHASVNIIDKSSGIWPSVATGGAKEQPEPFMAKTLTRSNTASNHRITGKYVVSSTNNDHMQMSLIALYPAQNPVKFKSMEVQRKSGDKETITLATVVNIPPDIAGGH